MTPPLMFRNIFHLGYVVRDIDKFTAKMADQFGVAKWKILRLPKGTAVSALGFAYTQDLMIELLEVDLEQELLPIFRDWIPASDTDARLNHVAYLVDSEDELQTIVSQFESAGVATAVRASFGDIFSQYYYADTVAQLGHYCEYVCLGPTGREFLADIPRN